MANVVRLSAPDHLSASADAGRVRADDAKRVLSKELRGDSASPSSPDGTYVLVPKPLAPPTSSPSDLSKLQAFLLSALSDRRNGLSEGWESAQRSSGSESSQISGDCRGCDSKVVYDDRGGCSRELSPPDDRVSGSSVEQFKPLAVRSLTESCAVLLKDGSDYQKELIRLFMSVSTMLSNSMKLGSGMAWGSEELKMFAQSSLATNNLDTVVVYSAPNFYRFPAVTGWQSITSGVGYNQRLGISVRVHHVRVVLRLQCFTTWQNLTTGVRARTYPIKIGLWRQKIDVLPAGAVNINPVSPNDPSHFYWDPLDTAVRTSTNLIEDSALSCVHNPSPAAKFNNVCEGETVFHPGRNSGVTAAGGAVTEWGSLPRGDYNDGPYITLEKFFPHGIVMDYQDLTTTSPQSNAFYVTLITDKPAPATLLTSETYSYALHTYIKFTDA